jgi:hypothetical protein
MINLNLAIGYGIRLMDFSSMWLAKALNAYVISLVFFQAF